MVSLNRFHEILQMQEARGYDLNEEQKAIVEHKEGPLWILAGPGTGKSEALVTRVLKLICVDNEAPGSIFLTTFTEKAARNLEDRIMSYLSVLQNEEPDLLKEIDISDIRMGTLHSLCNDILQEFRYPKYQNVRLLDQIEQDLFVYKNTAIANCKDLDFWRTFHYMFDNRFQQSSRYAPNKWARVKAARDLFNRLVEDLIDFQKMRGSRGSWNKLVDFYEEYQELLKERYRCDFAHLLTYFLEFIESSEGNDFVNGTNEIPPIKYILVDEYQDTNPIQEKIYLALAKTSPHNLCVVGDDDQALYRFRGGSVACMVNFDKACEKTYNVKPTTIQLQRNYRSHKDIVDFCNSYVSSFPEMNQIGVRAPNKKPLIASSNVSGSYPAVSWKSIKKFADIGTTILDILQNHLIADGVIQDLSQCVILMRSTKISSRNAQPIINALVNAGFDKIYNPRSKSFMDAEEVQLLLAVLINIIDSKYIFRQFSYSKNLIKTTNTWLDKYNLVLQNTNIDSTELQNYIQESQKQIIKMCERKANKYIGVSLHEILFRVLSLEPFHSWRKNPISNLRISKVTRLMEKYASLNMHKIKANRNGNYLSDGFLNRFYYMFLNYLIEAGINEDEEEEVNVPLGYLPIMTIHQAKGLEFPIVIATQIEQKAKINSTHYLENELSQFRNNFYNRQNHNLEQMSIEDNIRLLYVAYSRAQYVLIIVGVTNQMKKQDREALPARNFDKFRVNTLMI